MKKGFVPPEYEHPTYSTRIWRAYYQYILAHYDKSLFADICAELKMPLEYILADDNWVSNKFAADFVDLLLKKTGDPDIAEKVGKFSASPEVLNRIEYFLITTVASPAIFYYFLPKEYAKFNLFNEVKVKRFLPGKVVYWIRPKGEERAHPEICNNTKGMLACTEHLFDLDRITVTHDKCVHNGNQWCEFIVSYSSWGFWKKRFKILLGFLSAITVTKLGLDAFSESQFSSQSKQTVLVGLISILTSTLLFTFIRYFKLSSYILQYYEQSREKHRELYDSHRKLDRRYQEANLLREFSVRLSAEYESSSVIRACLDEIEKRFNFGRAFVMLLSADQSRLFTVESRGFGDQSSKISTLSVGYPSSKEGPQLFANILAKGDTVHITEIEAFKSKIKAENRDLVDSLGVTSLIVAPIQDADKKYGLLIIGSVGTEPPLTGDDLHLFENLTRLLSLSFRNILNFEREKGLRTLFQKYVPGEVLEGIEFADKNATVLAPQNSKISSMFVDLRGFTTRCEVLPPEKVVDALNIYTEFITARIANFGGIIDKFIGDGVVAFFVEKPGRSVYGSAEAIHSAIQILADLEQLELSFRQKGYDPPEIGIGIFSGLATVGNVGCDRKLNYTAIGDVVNIASRLQDMCKRFADRVTGPSRGVAVIGADTLRAAQINCPVTKIGFAAIRGRQQEVEVVLVDELQSQGFVKLPKAS